MRADPMLELAAPPQAPVTDEGFRRAPSLALVLPGVPVHHLWRRTSPAAPFP